MKYLSIVLNIPVNQSFTYLNSEKENERSLVGFRADLMFGTKHTKGFIVDEFDELPADLGFDPAKIRPIRKILDKEPVFNKELLELAKWMSRYYICSLGECISAMLPSGQRESNAGGFSFENEILALSKRELSDEQIAAVNGIIGSSAQNSSSADGKSAQYFHYLYGPTGTGKTEVFLQAADEMFSRGKGVIYLVPEISLTQQVVESVRARFGNTAAVLHSGLTPSQRLSEWNRIIKKEARVIVGARSAVFAPVPDLGLIIIDEEHDGSYKSGNTPRYHARQVAMYRCIKQKIPLVMGSATPSVEAWYLMKTGGIFKHTLTKRLAGGTMPKITTVNLSEQPTNSGCISPELKEEISETLKEKRQTILFLNRRGFTHFFRCNSCGFELKCKNCSVSMTFHKNEKRLKCHYCGWSTEPPQQCPQCGSLDVGYSGFGTEYIESEVKAKFPNAKIVRVDTDSITHKNELQEKIQAFKNGEYDIMLGTQMVAKGLNFPNLKLVGVVLADTSLYMPDFRASERTFSLITQVAGRAGRFFPDGKVLVQTYAPDREPIAYAVYGKTDSFYESELAAREMLNFPPFSRLVRLVFRSPSEKSAMNASYETCDIIKKMLSAMATNEKNRELCEKTEILGPSECPIAKISMNFRYQILLRSPQISILQYLAGKLIFDFRPPSDVYIECDVDPVSLL
ncbi:replication restart helicase PriA [Treponema zioleckii]|uniref:replication restart helicase PriA n=1 Tax=Treponema zioleckii TaxID=331680 RepID=UPI00168B536F|nr:primosomal protein N' [Treponema zioleckii]